MEMYLQSLSEITKENTRTVRDQYKTNTGLVQNSSIYSLPTLYAKARLNPLIELITGKMGNLVFRRAHTGKLSVIKKPNMSRVKWSPAQKAHRERFRQAVIYAKTAMRDPDIRPVYERMAAEKKSNKRPFAMAVSDYFDGNDLVWKKLYGDRPKPEGWWVRLSRRGQRSARR